MSLNSNNLKNISRICLPVWQNKAYSQEYEALMIATQTFHNVITKRR